MGLGITKNLYRFLKFSDTTSILIFFDGNNGEASGRRLVVGFSEILLAYWSMCVKIFRGLFLSAPSVHVSFNNYTTLR
jgi:hypothetical protein